MTQTQDGMRAMVFTFKGSECGVAVVVGQTGSSESVSAVYINRGPAKPTANFVSMVIPTNDGGGVQEIIDGAQGLANQASGRTNAAVGPSQRLTADSGAEIARTGITGAPSGNYATDNTSMVKRFNYSQSKINFSEISMSEKVDTISQFLGRQHGPVHSKVAGSRREGPPG